MNPNKTDDIGTIHLIVKAVVSLGVLCLVAGCGLVWHGDKDAATLVFGVTTTTAGGLIGLLAKTTTDNAPDAPSPTTTASDDPGADTKGTSN
jgi:hypothetical protein